MYSPRKITTSSTSTANQSVALSSALTQQSSRVYTIKRPPRSSRTGLQSPALKKEYVKNLAKISPEQVKGHLKPKTNQQSSRQKFKRMFRHELRNIPKEMHATVERAVSKRVEDRVKEYVEGIKEDV